MYLCNYNNKLGSYKEAFFGILMSVGIQKIKVFGNRLDRSAARVKNVDVRTAPYMPRVMSMK